MAALVRRTAVVMAWLALALIIFSTLSPIGMRPHLGVSVHVERFGAFAALGCLFAVAYPRRWLAIFVCVAGLAMGLEFLQTLVSSRHARWSDLGVKLAGGGAGILLAGFLPRPPAALERLLLRLNQNKSPSR